MSKVYLHTSTVFRMYLECTIICYIGRVRESLEPVSEIDPSESVVSLSAFTPYLNGPDEDDV